MANTVLHHLRADASGWWYFRQLRQQGRHAEAAAKERESIRRNVQHIREALANGGWLSIGRGGATLHTSPNSRLEGIHGHTIAACIAAGVPTLDSTGCDFDRVWDLAVRGPMPGFSDSTFGTNPDGSLSTRHWRTIFNRYATDPGAVFYNFAPSPDPWKPEPLEVGADD